MALDNPHVGDTVQLVHGKRGWVVPAIVTSRLDPKETGRRISCFSFNRFTFPRVHFHGSVIHRDFAKEGDTFWQSVPKG